MPPAKLFIASSSEGVDVAEAMHRLLVSTPALKHVEVAPWFRQFDLSKTNIESLEKACAEADFALFVLTADDVTTSRKKKGPSPRDNVVFELGLFMGSIGRDRCFIVAQAKTDLKVATDLAGVGIATFERSKEAKLDSALDRAAVQVAQGVADQPSRFKVSREVVASQESARAFAMRIEGSWWERMLLDDGNTLSFFNIEQDVVPNSVRLDGKSYGKSGAQAAKWDSLLARVDPGAKKIIYHWEGRHLAQSRTNVPFHGFGEMQFDVPSSPAGPITNGGGRFWNVDEFHPERTIVKPIQLRRVADPKAISTMTRGSEKAKQALVRKTLDEW
jgi:hypothetical protein